MADHDTHDHTGITGVGVGDATAHIADATDAHDASAISFVPDGSIAATNVQAAIVEVRDEAAAGAGSVATDAIWDAAGDTVVGTGANTAARLALGAAGGALSRVNGAVAWNSGTSFPSAATGDRIWRTDRGLEYYYDGTRWLTTTLFEALTLPSDAYTAGASGLTATSALQRWAPLSGTDVWLVDLRWTYQIPSGTHSGAAYWTLVFSKWDGTTYAGISTLTSNQSGAGWFNPAPTAIGALLGTANITTDVTATKVGAAGNLYVQAGFRYRIVG